MTMKSSKNWKKARDGGEYDASENPYTLCDTGCVDLVIRLGRDSRTGKPLALSGIQWPKNMTVQDILPHCPDEKRCLLNFKLGTPIRDVEKYYGMSLFMLA